MKAYTNKLARVCNKRRLLSEIKNDTRGRKKGARRLAKIEIVSILNEF